MAVNKTLVALATLLVISVSIRVGESAVSLQPPLDKPAKYAGVQGGCYSDILDVVLLPNVSVNPVDGVHCRRFLCHDNGNTQIHTSGVVVVPEGYKTASDLSKPYPDCCKKLVHPNDK